MKFFKWKWPLINIKETFSNFKERLYEKDGEKKKLNFKFIALLSVPLVIMGFLQSYFQGKKDLSYLAQTAEKLLPASQITTRDSSLSEKHPVIQNQKSIKSTHGSRLGPFKYLAHQVLGPHGDGSLFIGAGTSFVGKLLSSIDTRKAQQLIKVTLPYGGIFRSERIIEPGANIFGLAQYEGSGDKVFVGFFRLVTVDGTEYKLQAQALNTRDWTPGLTGDLHSNFDGRLMTSVGLNMLSAASDVLVEKESMGQALEVTPKSTLKNAALSGLSHAAQGEAERKISETGKAEEFVTIDAGGELLVNLTESFHGELFDQQ